jgi:hypothetical protein
MPLAVTPCFQGFHVFPLLSPALARQIEDYHVSAILDERMISFTPAIIHQDFGFHNILVDPEACRVTGVIDFGNYMPGDPVVDVFPEILRSIPGSSTPAGASGRNTTNGLLPWKICSTCVPVSILFQMQSRSASKS